MKCYICSHEVPEGKKCCPYCGRVITSSDKQRYAQQKKEENARQNQAQNTRNSGDSVYRPARTRNTSEEKTIHIPDLFSSDPNAPEYTDPHSYDRATADVLAYDREFISGSDEAPTRRIRMSDQEMDYMPPRNRTQPAETDYPDDDGYYDDDYVDDEAYDEPAEDDYYDQKAAVSRNKRQSRPHLRFNVKIFIICIAVLLGIVIVIVGGYQIGEQFGIFGEDPSGSSVSADGEGGKKTAEPKSDDAAVQSPATSNKTGKYTVVTDANNIFAYKSETDPRIVATIPNKTVIEITEISGDLGKTTYNGFTGWVKLSDLEYTAAAEPGSAADTNNGNDSPAGDAYASGTYTVDLNGDGDSVNVRSEASSYSTLLTTIPEGTELTVDKIDGNWGHITYEGIEGWVFMDYMKQ